MAFKALLSNVILARKVLKMSFAVWKSIGRSVVIRPLFSALEINRPLGCNPATIFWNLFLLGLACRQWDSSGTALGQLWDGSGAAFAFEQLWDSFGAALGQLWDSSGTALG